MRMWSLQELPFTLCMALSCVSSAAGLIHVAGYEGREAHVSCSYPEGYESYEKYLCKNDCGHDDVLILTTSGKKNKYSIHDDRSKRVFTTTISNLARTDAGKYWCGVTRNGKDIYTEVKLQIEQDTCCDQSTKVQGHETGSVSISCPFDIKYQNDLKYICRGNQPSTCLQQAAIISPKQQNGRFRLDDDKAKKFTVTINNLTQEDSGSYLCGIYRNNSLDVFSAVELEVKEWCCVTSSELNGTVGRPVTIQCPYPPQHKDNRKFLCKGDHRNTCADMVTSQSRFTLQDDVSSSSFSVTVTELRAGDAGTYWCGSDAQWSAGNYTKIQLSVVFPQQSSTVESGGSQSTDKPTEIFQQQVSTVEEPFGSQSENIPGKHNKDASPLHPVVFILPAVLLVVVFVLVIVYRYKCNKVREASVNMSGNETKVTKAVEVTDAADIYTNQDVVAYSKQRKSKPPPSAFDHYDDAGEDEQDSVYQNFTTEEIYCNQF